MTSLARQIPKAVAHPPTALRSNTESARGGLEVGRRNDAAETEAEQYADRVLALPTQPIDVGLPLIHRAASEQGAQEGFAPSSVERVLASPGVPMNGSMRHDMEHRFARDFSGVRIHSDSAAEESARDVHANAYTVGQNIVFGRGQLAPDSIRGRRLIAHELTHVAQQGEGAATVLRRDANSSEPIAGNSGFDQAFALADECRWEQVAAIVNGFSPQNLRHFLATFKGQADKLAQIHLGALGNPKVGPGSQVAQATRATYLDFNFIVESRKGDWSRAALYINGFSREDIRARFNKTETEKLKALHEGAATNVQLGVDSAAAQVSAEVLAARSAKGETKALLLPTVRGEGKEALLHVTRVIDGIKPSTTVSGGFTMTVDGQPQTLTAAQVDEVKKRTASALKDHLRAIENKASSAADGYQGQSEVDRRHWIVAPIVKTLGRVKDPGPELMAYAFRASQSVKWAREAIDAGNLSHAAEKMAAAEAAAISAMKMWQAYFQGIIGAGEMTVTVLEITRDAAFITLAILATIATGGAAAGALGAAEGTAATATAFGVELGVSSASAANLIAIGAPIVANVSEATAKVAMGDKVDWGALVIDTAVQIIIARFGGKVTGGIAKALLGNPATERLASKVTEKVVHAVIMHTGSVALTTASQDAYRALKGQPVTWEMFIDEVITRLTDPKSLAVMAVAGVVGSAAEAKYGGSKPGASQPASTATAARRPMSEVPPSKVSATAPLRTTPKAAGSGGGAVPTAAATAEPVTQASPSKTLADEPHPTTSKNLGRGDAEPHLAPASGHVAGGATASGFGEDFAVTRHPEPPRPEVTIRPKRPTSRADSSKAGSAKQGQGRSASSSATGESANEQPATSARNAADIAEVFDELTEGTGRGKSPSHTDVIDLPKSGLKGSGSAGRAGASNEGEYEGMPRAERPRPAVGLPESVEAGRTAGLPDEVLHSGTVLTGRDFTDIVPDRPLARGKPAPKLPPAADELKRGIAGRRPTSAPDPTDVQHTELLGDISMTEAHIKAAGGRVTEVAINRRQRTGPADAAEAVSNRTRPDLQLAVIDAQLNGKRVLIEYDRAPGTRAMSHARQILLRDPNAIVIVKIIGFDQGASR